RRLAILTNIGNSGAMLEAREVEATARTLDLEVVTPDVQRAEDIAAALESLKDRVEALYVIADPLITTSRIRINTLALRARIPTMHSLREFVEVGGLMSYGPNMLDLFRRAGELRDRSPRGRSQPERVRRIGAPMNVSEKDTRDVARIWTDR